MKRGAERQLVKDDRDDEEFDDSEPGQAFKKADESVLATRKIRGLPRRSMATTPTASPVANGAPTAPSTPKLEPTSIFGSSSSSSLSFTFTPPPASPTPSTSSPTPFSFGSKTSAAPPPPTSAFSFSNPPAVSPSATSAAKTFASFLGSPPSESGSTKSASTTSQMPPSKPDPAAESDAIDSAAAKYYTALRGINVSFMTALNRAVDENPFVDVAEILEQYTKLRATIQKDFDSATEAEKPKTKPSAPAPAPAMPAPPLSFAGFGNTTTEKPASSSLGGGFVPKVENTTSTKSAFTFPSSTSSSSTSTSSSSSSQPSFFGTSSAFAGSKDSTPPFGTSTSTSTTPIPLTFGTSTSSSTPPPPLTFGTSTTTTNPFEIKSSSSSGGFSFATAPKSDNAASVAASLFGQPPSSSSSGNSLFGSAPAASQPAAAPSSNPFGIASSTTTSTPATNGGKFGGFGGFGKPAGGSGSIGNPVGFGFGSPPKTPDLGTATGTGSGTSSFGGGFGSGGFSFGKAPESSGSNADKEKEKEKDTEGGESQSTQGESSSSPGDGEVPNLIATTNPNDEEGEGEEDEDTVHAIKLKAYRLTKKDGTSSWAELGHGILRIKKHKELGTRRLLLRNSSTGKININFNIYASLKPSITKRAIMFVGHDDGASVTYNVRLQSEDQAKELKDILDREIAFVKAKTES
ncbi:hypothetical protein ONZ45_g8061 [Pleurotus djamor]|nr:hypothetical protein ONZ45_g8061 [Pleurotus djamor]